MFCAGLCFWYELLYVLPRFAIILTRKTELVSLLLLSFGCLVTVNVLLLFLTVPWVGLQCVIEVFPDHTHLLFEMMVLLLLLMISCFMYLPLFWGFCVGLWFGTHYLVSFRVSHSS